MLDFNVPVFILFEVTRHPSLRDRSFITSQGGAVVLIGGFLFFNFSNSRGVKF